MLDLAGDQRRAPEQPGQDGQEQQQQAGQGQALEAAAEPLAERAAAVFGGHELGLAAAQAGLQAQVVEGGVQLAAGRDQEQRHRHQGDGRGQGLLAVLAPDQPGHACTSSRSLAAAAGPGSVPADGSAR